MKDIQLYEQILGLAAPWRVDEVKLKVKEQEIEVRVSFGDTIWGCPECQQRMVIHDYEERRWRHLDSCQFKTVIIARMPVVKGPTHGTQTVAAPWAEKYARFSRLFERLAIDVMQACSISGACKLLRISWDEADGIKQRAVKRGLARKTPAVMPRLCVDEKGMGHGHSYLTIVARAEAGLDDGGICWRGTATEQFGCVLGGFGSGATGGDRSGGDGHVESLYPIDAGPCAWGGGQDCA